MLQNKVYLSNQNVNSGSSLNMNATDINTSWDIFTNVNNTPRTTVGNSYNSNLSNGNNQGFKNPEHTVNGVIDLSTTHDSSTIDREFVEGLINNSHIVMSLQCDKFKTTSNTTGTINVMLKNYSDKLSNTNVLTYNMSFVEVNS